MKEHFAYDRVLKDLFQSDHPSLLKRLTGGVPVREFLNVEFPRVMEWRADLVALLEDESVFHFEFQGQNDKRIAYREGIYCLLIVQKYRRPVKQVVLYVGNSKMRISSQLDAGGTKVSFRLIDIRELDAETLLQTGCAGDLALALLAKGGSACLNEIAQRAAALSDSARVRVLTQLAVLSGLRGLSERLRLEMMIMKSLRIEIRDNAILREVWDDVMAEGQAKGETSGMAKLLRGLLQTKFGRIPRWAEVRLRMATADQIERWSQQFIDAKRVEDVISR